MKEHNPSNGSYNRHLLAGEDPCDECRLKHNEYQRKWRLGGAGRLSNRRQRKALAILRDRHYSEYLRITSELKEAEDAAEHQ